MANKNFWLGILVMVQVFGITVVGCDNDSTNNNGNGGILTLTDIPLEYNEKYAYFQASFSNGTILGGQNINPQTGETTLSKITNGIVNIPLWVGTNNSIEKYSGNDTVDNCGVVIFNSSILNSETANSERIIGIVFQEITFSKGNSTISFDEKIIQ